MKRDRKLISEIKRLNELMGNKSQLNEQVGLIDDILLALTKVGTKQTDELSVAAAKLSDESLSPKKRAQALEDVIRIARKNGDDDLIKQINKTLMGSELLSQGVDEMVKKSEEIINAGLERNASKQDLLSMLYDDFNPNTGDDVLDAFIKRQYRNKLGTRIDNIIKGIDDDILPSATKTGDDVAPTRITDDPSTPKTGDDVTKSSDEVVDDVVDDTSKLTDKEVEETLDVLEETPWGDIETIDEEAANHILDSYQGGRFGRWIRGDFRTATEVLEDRMKNALRLSKYYTEGAKPAVKARIEEKLKKDLYDIAVNFKKVSKETQSELTDIINSFERDARGNIINVNEKRFADYIGKLSDETDNFTNIEKMMGLTPEGRKSVSIFVDALKASFSGKNLWSTTRNIGKSVNNFRMSIIGREMDKATKETAEKIAQDRGRTWRWLTSGSPRGNPLWKRNQKNYLDIITSKGLSGARKSYALELLFRLIQWKVSFGLLYTFRNYLSYVGVGTERRNMINKCLSSEDKKVDCADVDTWIESWALDFMEGSTESKKRWLKDFAEQTYGVGWWDNLTDIVPGKLDDAIQFAYTFFEKSADDATMEELEDNIDSGLNDAQQGAEQAQEEIERATEEGITLPGQGDQQDDSSSSSSGEPGSLQHANEYFGGGVTQEGELFIYDGDKFKFNGTDYEWVP